MSFSLLSSEDEQKSEHDDGDDGEWVNTHNGILSIPLDHGFQQEQMRLQNVRQQAATYGAEARAARSKIIDLEGDCEVLDHALAALSGKITALEHQRANAACSGARRAHLEAKLTDLRAMHAHEEAEVVSKRREVAQWELDLGEAELRSDEFATLAASLCATEQKYARRTQARVTNEAAAQRRAAVARQKQAASHTRLLEERKQRRGLTTNHLRGFQAEQERTAQELSATQKLAVKRPKPTVLASDTQWSEPQKRLETLLNLKRNCEEIDLKDRQLMNEKLRRRAQQTARLDKEREQLLAQGLNPDAVFLARKREGIAQAEKMATELRKQQNSARIAEKLAREQSRLSKQQQRRERSALDNLRRTTGRHHRRPDNTDTDPGSADEDDTLVNVVAPVSANRALGLSTSSTITERSIDTKRSIDSAVLVHALTQAETLLNPEDSDDELSQLEQQALQGLWNQSWTEAEGSQLTLPGDTTPVKKSLKEKRREAALVRQRTNITQKQVVAGREFQGVSFSCSPSAVIFADFDVERSYRQKLVLTNTSYGTNSFQLLPSPCKSITYEYSPSGGLSAGMSTEMAVVFSPRDNCDFEGALALLAQDGPFSIPIQCLTRKCLPVVAFETVVFGHVCRGDTVTETLRLENKGALATAWECVPEHGDSTFVCVRTNGLLEGHSLNTIQFSYSPTAVGADSMVFMLRFEQLGVQPIALYLKGECTDLPVAFETPRMNFQLCPYGGRFNAEFVVRNTGSALSTVKLEVPADAKTFLQVSPKAATIRSKELVRGTLVLQPQSGMGYVDKDTGRLEVPITLHASGQALPTTMVVQADITSNEVTVTAAVDDFGAISVQETAVAIVTLVNHSALTRDFGFVGHPDYVSLQPNHGFGTLLPFETLVIEMLVSPGQAEIGRDVPFTFVSTCRWQGDDGRGRRLGFKGVAIAPPLRLSTAQLRFPPVAFGSTTLAALWLSNCRAVPQSFEFVCPAASPVQMEPYSGCLAAGERRKIIVRITAPGSSPRPIEESEPTADDVQRQLSVLTVDVPCYWPQDTTNLSELRAVTVTVEVPLTFPAVTLVLDEVGNGIGLENFPDDTYAAATSCKTIDFGSLAPGHTVSHHLTLHNHSATVQYVRASALGTDGPFELANALRPIPPGARHRLLLVYAPLETGSFHDTLYLVTSTHTITVTLRGEATLPRLELVPTDLLDFGPCLVRHFVERGLRLTNNSTFAVSCKIYFSSADPTHVLTETASRDCVSGLPVIHCTGPVGGRNFQGHPVFVVSPSKLHLDPGSQHDLTVRFAPDHASDMFFDQLHIAVMSTPFQPCTIPVRGTAWNHPVFITGTDKMDYSRSDDPLLADLQIENPLYVVFKVSLSRHKNQGALTRILTVGVAASLSLDTRTDKKNTGGDFSFEQISGPDATCFTIQPMEGVVTVDVPKQITVRFANSSGQVPLCEGQTFDSSVAVQLKSGSIARVVLHLKAVVCA